jgi:hypothetical protein
MPAMEVSTRRAALIAVSLLALGIAAVPVLGQEGSASPAPTPVPTIAPAATDAPGTKARPGKPDKAAKVPELPVSLTGRIGSTTDADGEVSYTFTVGSTVYTLDAGPSWWWGESHPLAGMVGRTVSLEGERAEGATEIDVFVAGGTVIREAGKPPWAGGWKVVGERHPGWSQEKADRWAEKLAKWAEKWPDGKPGNGPRLPDSTTP